MPKVGYNEPAHDKANVNICAPSENSDQPVHPHNLIRVFAVRMKKSGVLRYPFERTAKTDQTARMRRLV